MRYGDPPVPCDAVECKGLRHCRRRSAALAHCRRQDGPGPADVRYSRFRPLTLWCRGPARHPFKVETVGSNPTRVARPSSKRTSHEEGVMIELKLTTEEAAVLI